MIAFGDESSFASVRAELDSLKINDEQLAYRVRVLEKLMDTKNSPLWKRLIFRLDGWGPWYQLNDKPHWRPWRRWWTS